MLFHIQVGVSGSEALARDVTTRTEPFRTADQALSRPAPRARPLIPATICGRAATLGAIPSHEDARSRVAETAAAAWRRPSGTVRTSKNAPAGPR